MCFISSGSSDAGLYRATVAASYVDDPLGGWDTPNERLPWRCLSRLSCGRHPGYMLREIRAAKTLVSGLDIP